MDAEKELALQAPPTEQVYGIAKKMSLELEKLPLHTEAAVISIMNMMCQHRKVVLETEMQAKQHAAQQEALESARLAHARAQVERENRDAGDMRAKAEKAGLVLA